MSLHRSASIRQLVRSGLLMPRSVMSCARLIATGSATSTSSSIHVPSSHSAEPTRTEHRIDSSDLGSDVLTLKLQECIAQQDAMAALDVSSSHTSLPLHLIPDVIVLLSSSIHSQHIHDHAQCTRVLQCCTNLFDDLISRGSLSAHQVSLSVALRHIHSLSLLLSVSSMQIPIRDRLLSYLDIVVTSLAGSTDSFEDIQFPLLSTSSSQTTAVTPLLLQSSPTEQQLDFEPLLFQLMNCNPSAWPLALRLAVRVWQFRLSDSSSSTFKPLSCSAMSSLLCTSLQHGCSMAVIEQILKKCVWPLHAADSGSSQFASTQSAQFGSISVSVLNQIASQSSEFDLKSVLAFSNRLASLSFHSVLPLSSSALLPAIVKAASSRLCLMLAARTTPDVLSSSLTEILDWLSSGLKDSKPSQKSPISASHYSSLLAATATVLLKTRSKDQSAELLSILSSLVELIVPNMFRSLEQEIAAVSDSSDTDINSTFQTISLSLQLLYRARLQFQFPSQQLSSSGLKMLQHLVAMQSSHPHIQIELSNMVQLLTLWSHVSIASAIEIQNAQTLLESYSNLGTVRQALQSNSQPFSNASAVLSSQLQSTVLRRRPHFRRVFALTQLLASGSFRINQSMLATLAHTRTASTSAIKLLQRSSSPLDQMLATHALFAQQQLPSFSPQFTSNTAQIQSEFDLLLALQSDQNDEHALCAPFQRFRDSALYPLLIPARLTELRNIAQFGDNDVARSNALTLIHRIRQRALWLEQHFQPLADPAPLAYITTFLLSTHCDIALMGIESPAMQQLEHRLTHIFPRLPAADNATRLDQVCLDMLVEHASMQLCLDTAFAGSASGSVASIDSHATFVLNTMIPLLCKHAQSETDSADTVRQLTILASSHSPVQFESTMHHKLYRVMADALARPLMTHPLWMLTIRGCKSFVSTEQLSKFAGVPLLPPSSFFLPRHSADETPDVKYMNHYLTSSVSTLMNANSAVLSQLSRKLRYAASDSNAFANLHHVPMHWHLALASVHSLKTNDAVAALDFLSKSVPYSTSLCQPWMQTALAVLPSAVGALFTPEIQSQLKQSTDIKMLMSYFQQSAASNRFRASLVATLKLILRILHMWPGGARSNIAVTLFSQRDSASLNQQSAVPSEQLKWLASFVERQDSLSSFGISPDMSHALKSGRTLRLFVSLLNATPAPNATPVVSFSSDATSSEFSFSNSSVAVSSDPVTNLTRETLPASSESIIQLLHEFIRVKPFSTLQTVQSACQNNSNSADVQQWCLNVIQNVQSVSSSAQFRDFDTHGDVDQVNQATLDDSLLFEAHFSGSKPSKSQLNGDSWPQFSNRIQNFFNLELKSLPVLPIKFDVDNRPNIKDLNMISDSLLSTGHLLAFLQFHQQYSSQQKFLSHWLTAASALLQANLSADSTSTFLLSSFSMLDMKIPGANRAVLPLFLSLYNSLSVATQDSTLSMQLLPSVIALQRILEPFSSSSSFSTSSSTRPMIAQLLSHLPKLPVIQRDQLNESLSVEFLCALDSVYLHADKFSVKLSAPPVENVPTPALVDVPVVKSISSEKMLKAAPATSSVSASVVVSAVPSQPAKPQVAPSARSPKSDKKALSVFQAGTGKLASKPQPAKVAETRVVQPIVVQQTPSALVGELMIKTDAQKIETEFDSLAKSFADETRVVAKKEEIPSKVVVPAKEGQLKKATIKLKKTASKAVPKQADAVETKKISVVDTQVAPPAVQAVPANPSPLVAELSVYRVADSPQEIKPSDLETPSPPVSKPVLSQNLKSAESSKSRKKVQDAKKTVVSKRVPKFKPVKDVQVALPKEVPEQKATEVVQSNVLPSKLTDELLSVRAVAAEPVLSQPLIDAVPSQTASRPAVRGNKIVSGKPIKIRVRLFPPIKTRRVISKPISPKSDGRPSTISSTPAAVNRLELPSQSVLMSELVSTANKSDFAIDSGVIALEFMPNGVASDSKPSVERAILKHTSKVAKSRPIQKKPVAVAAKPKASKPTDTQTKPSAKASSKIEAQESRNQTVAEVAPVSQLVGELTRTSSGERIKPKSFASEFCSPEVANVKAETTTQSSQRKFPPTIINAKTAAKVVIKEKPVAQEQKSKQKSKSAKSKTKPVQIGSTPIVESSQPREQLVDVKPAQCVNIPIEQSKLMSELASGPVSSASSSKAFIADFVDSNSEKPRLPKQRPAVQVTNKEKEVKSIAKAIKPRVLKVVNHQTDSAETTNVSKQASKTSKPKETKSKVAVSKVAPALVGELTSLTPIVAVSTDSGVSAIHPSDAFAASSPPATQKLEPSSQTRKSQSVSPVSKAQYQFDSTISFGARVQPDFLLRQFNHQSLTPLDVHALTFQQRKDALRVLLLEAVMSEDVQKCTELIRALESSVPAHVDHQNVPCYSQAHCSSPLLRMPPGHFFSSIGVLTHIVQRRQWPDAFGVTRLIKLPASISSTHLELAKVLLTRINAWLALQPAYFGVTNQRIIRDCELIAPSDLLPNGWPKQDNLEFIVPPSGDSHSEAQSTPPHMESSIVTELTQSSQSSQCSVPEIEPIVDISTPANSTIFVSEPESVSAAALDTKSSQLPVVDEPITQEIKLHINPVSQSDFTRQTNDSHDPVPENAEIQSSANSTTGPTQSETVSSITDTSPVEPSGDLNASPLVTPSVDTTDSAVVSKSSKRRKSNADATNPTEKKPRIKKSKLASSSETVAVADMTLLPSEGIDVVSDVVIEKPKRGLRKSVDSAVPTSTDLPSEATIAAESKPSRTRRAKSVISDDSTPDDLRSVVISEAASEPALQNTTDAAPVTKTSRSKKDASSSASSLASPKPRGRPKKVREFGTVAGLCVSHSTEVASDLDTVYSKYAEL